MALDAVGFEQVRAGTFQQELREFHTTANGLPSNDVHNIMIEDGSVVAHTSAGWVRREDDQWVKTTPATGESHSIEARKTHAKQQLTALSDSNGGSHSPLNDPICVSAAPNATWFCSARGVARFDGHDWAYRQGLRWLPSDDVRAVAAAADGSAWIATAGGISHISFRPMTLLEKAAHYESEIDQYNRRTEFGYVIEAHTKTPGDKTSLTRHDSDNDGLWTAMYGAGECFAWAATKDPLARQRAKNAFEALRFLSIAPRGGSNPAPRGFIARTVLPITEPDPNKRPGYTLAGQKKNQQERDRMWRAYEPRWPVTEDGKYYWKSDTSSDELDGHYFFYALYFDLVADTKAEKDRVREIVRDNINHMIDRDFKLCDHAGPTRWADYSPSSLNHDPRWFVERGLNSLSMLSYLATAAHITGDSRYREVAAELRDKHGYAQNVMVPKMQAGIGTGNQSDDEMAFMCFYNLLKYEDDPKLNMLYRYAFRQYWALERPEGNPFFNYCYAAGSQDREFSDQWGVMSLAPGEGWQEESADTLRRFPLDRFNWGHDNSHRADIFALPGPALETSGRMMRKNGKVIPVDECHFNHWNYNPWNTKTGGGGTTLSDGAVYLLPAYMGLYHGFVTN